MRYLLLTLLFMGCDYAPTEHTHPEPKGACTMTVQFLVFQDSDLNEYGLVCKDGLTRSECEDVMAPREFHFYYTCEEYCDRYDSVYAYSCSAMDSLYATF